MVGLPARGARLHLSKGQRLICYPLRPGRAAPCSSRESKLGTSRSSRSASPSSTRPQFGRSICTKSLRERSAPVSASPSGRSPKLCVSKFDRDGSPAAHTVNVKRAILAMAAGLRDSDTFVAHAFAEAYDAKNAAAVA